MGSIAAMQDAARRIDAANTGYSQARRWSFFNRVTNEIIRNKDGDCSSVCAAIIKLGGYPINLSYPDHSGVYTGNFAAKAQAAGFTLLPFTGLANLKPGDFVCKPGKHVEFVSSAGRMFSAWMDENGVSTGGMPGEQAAHEVRYTQAYNYSGGWTQVLRPPANITTTTTNTTTSTGSTVLPEGIDDMQIVTLTGNATQYLLGADGTIIALPNIEYAQVANAMVAKNLKGINKRQRDVLLDICKRMKAAR